MSDRLRSVGLDVGTSTTQLILSELTVQNAAGSFAVPRLEITERKVLYESPVYFTPLLDESHVDGQKLRAIVEQAYEAAGIDRKYVDTGAIIITGETSRKENAQAVLQELSGFAGDFVVATAGPDLESVLAAKGAGADAYSAKTGKTVLHMDIGGGTSNLARIENGHITKTGCLNVGGRLVKLDGTGKVTYVSPVLQGLTELRVGRVPQPGQLEALARLLTRALEMAAGLSEKTDLLDRLWTKECGAVWEDFPQAAVLSFSGGVAECIRSLPPANQFGDIGPILGKTIRESSLCRGEYRLPKDAIRATVIGAGCHSAQLSGSTVYCRGVTLPVKNLPVAVFTRQEQESKHLQDLIQQRIAAADSENVVLALPGLTAPAYSQVKNLAEKIVRGCGARPVLVCLRTDMAKALGQCIGLMQNTPCLCLDSVALTPGSYLDVGAPVGSAYPVVVKTLVLSKQE